MSELPLEVRAAVDALMDERYHAACAAATAYVRSQAGTILEAAGYWSLSREPRPAAQTAAALGLADAAVAALSWLLEEVAAAHGEVLAAAGGDMSTFVPLGPLPPGYWASARE